MNLARLAVAVLLLPQAALAARQTKGPGAPITPGSATRAAAVPALPAAAVPAAAASAAQAPKSAPQAALPVLGSMAQPAESGAAAGAASAEPSALQDQAFDGSVPAAAFEPSFEPRVSGAAPAQVRRSGVKAANDSGAEARRPTLSFGPAVVPSLMAIDADKAIYGTVKRVRANEGSRGYWGEYKTGTVIDVVSRGESVYGRPTEITSGYNKRIGKLTREDLRGIFTKAQLRASIKTLRAILIEQLEENRKAFKPNDEAVTLESVVRVIRFKSFLDLYRESHGADSIPQPEKPTARIPLTAKPEGKLARLPNLLPRAVYLDVDALEGPISSELLSDMMKLQRTGVYFVAFSRLPYSAPGGMREKLIRKMSSYQLNILLPIRFLAVTDNGAVISAFPKGGNVSPIDVNAFSDSEIDVLRDAAHKASEAAGLSPRAVREVPQPGIREAVDEFPGLKRRFSSTPRDPHVRYEVSLPKAMDAIARQAWVKTFSETMVRAGVRGRVAATASGVSVSRGDLASSMERVGKALGDQFGLWVDGSDLAVLSPDPVLLKSNPDLDFPALTGLKGSALVENVLGLMLGEHRENLEGDLSGSASRMAQFTRDRTRYLSDFLIKQDGSEQNINFFSGHVVHAAQDWLVWHLKNGRRPTEAEFTAHVVERWEAGIREFKPVGLPRGEQMDGWIRESAKRGVSMYHQVLAIHDRGEILIGTEIPNFFMVKDYKRRTSELKRRYVLHTIFDFVALRPDPKNPGQATLVIYDFKTGPAQSRQKLDKDLQVLTYAMMAHQRWVGKDFPAPYFSGEKTYKITDAKVEFIYNAVKQPTTVTAWDRETIRRKIIGTLNRIRAGELKMLGEAPEKPRKAPIKRK